MNSLRISLFGCVRILNGGPENEIRLPHKICALLSYLLLERHRTHSRDALAGLFWGEQSQSRARDCLNTALWRLRLALEPEGVPTGTYLLGSHSEEVGFNPLSSYWLDVAEFEDRAGKVLSTPMETAQQSEIDMGEESLALYTGDLLEGYYDDWALYERERLRAVYIDCLVYLLKYRCSHGEYDKGIIAAQKILRLDPLREEVHRELMEIYALNGQPQAALQQYKTCCRFLKEELDIPPLEETQVLYHQIYARLNGGKANPLSVEDMKDQLYKVKGLIANLEIQVQQIIQMIEGRSQ